MEMTHVFLSCLLISMCGKVLLEVGSHSPCLSSQFFSSSLFIILFAPQCLIHNYASHCHCATLLLPPLPSSITLSLMSFLPCLHFFLSPLSSWSCWTEKSMVTSTRKQPYLFASSHIHFLKCLCMCILRAMADIRKSKNPPLLSSPLVSGSCSRVYQTQQNWPSSFS